MKFGKELSSQMVPEWEQAYISYDYLKTLLKEMIKLKHTTDPLPPPHHASSGEGLSRKMTLYRAFSGLVQTSGKKRQSSGQDNYSEIDIEEGTAPILVNKASNGLETTFLMTAEEGGEYELVFFRRLDDEFNKIEKFYKDKVEEVVKDAIMLNKQMDALIAFRVKVENPIDWGWEERTVEMSRLASGIATSTAAITASTPSRTRTIKPRAHTHMEVIEEGGSMRANEDEDEHEHEGDVRTSNLAKMKGSRPAPLEVLDHIKINNTKATPRSTIKSVLHSSSQNEVKFTRHNLNEVEEKLKFAFIEFYQKLRLLKSYSFLNVLAFSKILKKYDKITSRKASKAYMKMVDNSYLGYSDELMKLIQRVEATFIKHFANGNRRKGMNILRPQMKRERHRVTFSTGFSAGCVFSLIVALITIIRTRKTIETEHDTYMNTMFRLYSLFGFIVLHITMYAINIYYWKRYRVNYAFIFGYKQGTELGYKQVLFVGFSIGVFALLCILGNLDMEVHPKTKDYQAITELLPVFYLLALFVVLILPFGFFYRSSRFFFLTSLFHCLAAPLYKVTLPDYFLGDQLTSQVEALRSIVFYICYYGWGDFKKRQNTCNSDIYKYTLYVVAVIPYLSRLLQCLRRMIEERSIDQGYNGVKYFLTIVAVCLRTAYGYESDLKKKSKFLLRVLAGSSSVLAAVVSTYWDFVHDWGLLKRTSKNRWLRDKLLVPQKKVYFIAMILNVVLRFAWLQTVLGFDFKPLHKQTTLAVMACLEIIRRGIWNFFRLENEHLNNVGKFRAFKSVPLPFNYDEDDEKDD